MKLKLGGWALVGSKCCDRDWESRDCDSLLMLRELLAVGSEVERQLEASSDGMMGSLTLTLSLMG